MFVGFPIPPDNNHPHQHQGPSCPSAPTKIRGIPENREIFESAFSKIAASIQHPLPFRKCVNGVEIRPRLMIAQNKGILAILNSIDIPGKGDFRLPHILNVRIPFLTGDYKEEVLKRSPNPAGKEGIDVICQTLIDEENLPPITTTRLRGDTGAVKQTAISYARSPERRRTSTLIPTTQRHAPGEGGLVMTIDVRAAAAPVSSCLVIGGGNLKSTSLGIVPVATFPAEEA
jgi:hypothetical protein